MKRILSIAIIVFVLFDLVLLAWVVTKDRDVVVFTLPTAEFDSEIDDSSLPPIPKIASVTLLKKETLATGRNVKSVVFSPSGEKLYSVNLEGGNVYEFDRVSRKISRKLIFKQTPAKGYDYESRTWIANSFAEKPVEACFSHNGRYLWVSLHNAEGIVACDLEKGNLVGGDELYEATLEVEGKKPEKVSLPFFKTGKTPKVLAVSKDNKYLFVANWHSNSLSVLDISSTSSADWKVVKEVLVGSVPRGMCFSEDGTRLFVGQMGSNTISTIQLSNLEVKSTQIVGRTPRHLVSDGRNLLVSLSSPEKIIRLSQKNLKPSRTVTTKDDPRTIALSADKSLLFTVCYADDALQVFDSQTLKLLHSEPSSHKPVGVDVFQKGDLIEVWVGNYSSSTIKVFTFKVEFEPFL